MFLVPREGVYVLGGSAGGGALPACTMILINTVSFKTRIEFGKLHYQSKGFKYKQENSLQDKHKQFLPTLLFKLRKLFPSLHGDAASIKKGRQLY